MDTQEETIITYKEVLEAAKAKDPTFDYVELQEHTRYIKIFANASATIWCDICGVSDIGINVVWPPAKKPQGLAICIECIKKMANTIQAAIEKEG